MAALLHALKCFNCDEKWSLMAGVEREDAVLGLEFRLKGDLSRVRIPEQAAPERRDELWQHTCFEAFVGLAGSPGYWELNLSPSGEWNVYRFTKYREGMLPESEVTLENSRVERAGSELIASCRLRLPVLAQAPSVDISLTSVIEDESGAKTYWALKHVGAKPDFHLRESFVLRK